MLFILKIILFFYQNRLLLNVLHIIVKLNDKDGIEGKKYFTENNN